jgi:hypothetical protein
MPTRRSFYWSGVRVCEDRAMDGWFRPNRHPLLLVDIPDYEEALVEGLRRLVRPGDRVVVVGGGSGVTSVVAAQAAGVSGQVWSYEASESKVTWMRSTCALNRKLRPMAPLQLVHAFVGATRPAVDTTSGVVALEPNMLPACDVLQLDCEGAELGILEGMTIRPRGLVVETHGVFGAPTPAVQKLIESRGYGVLSVRLAEERMQDLHVAQDVRVIVAVRDELLKGRATHTT